MVSPASASASTSAPLSLSLPIRINFSLSRFPSSFSRFPHRRVTLPPTRPCAALLSNLSDAREQDEELDYYEEDEDYEDEGLEEQEYDDDDEGEELVEVGYVSGVHGVRGDVLVTPRTDFPELRFATVTNHSHAGLCTSLRPNVNSCCLTKF